MKYARPKGFVVIMTLSLVTLLGGALLIMTLSSKTLAFDANWAYYQACERNLAASGFAWADYQVLHLDKVLTVEPLNLDIESMQIPQGGLTISLADPNIAELTVEVKTTCGRESMLLHRVHKYSLKF